MYSLADLRQRRDEILPIATRYGVKRIRVFGSFARDEARDKNDVDLLVDFEAGRSLLDLVGFEQDVSELLGCRVDVVSEGGLSPHLEAAIRREAVPL